MSTATPVCPVPGCGVALDPDGTCFNGHPQDQAPEPSPNGRAPRRRSRKGDSNISGQVPARRVPDAPPMTLAQVEAIYARRPHDGDPVTTRVVHAEHAHGGLLRRVGSQGILVVKDFTSILEMDRTARGQVLAALREVYDGRWDREVGAEGGQTLTWQGKCGFLAGCTTSIDKAHSVMNDMGPRSLFRSPSAIGRGTPWAPRGTGSAADGSAPMRPSAIARKFASSPKPAV